jgi:hypothetical protein
MTSYRPRHSDHIPGIGSPLDPEKMKQFKKLGWYSIVAWTEPCPECGCLRGGTPGYYWHLIRENTDDEERVREVHGERETE